MSDDVLADMFDPPGWAATNTLRVFLNNPVQCEKPECPLCRRYGLGEDALALVEAALDAAEQAVHDWERVLPRSPENFAALAAALRAVREGK